MQLITKYHKIIIVIILSVHFLGCPKDDPPTVVIPPTNCEPPIGNRNFNWRVDTIAWYPSTIGGVWAFSDSDVYVLGSIVDGKPPYSGRFGRHWNGKIWEDSINGTWGYNNTTGKWGDITIAPRNDVIGDDHFMVGVGFWGQGSSSGVTYYAGIAEFNNTTKKWKSYQLQSVGELRSVWTDGNGYFIAVGDNGMVYTKDGYNSGWIYQKAPTDFNFTNITGVSKTEMYSRTYISLTSGQNYHQYWKYNGVQWMKLYDEQDTSGTIIKLTGTDNSMNDVASYRCPITDSLKLYLIGWESFLLEATGQELKYRNTNLTQLGLPLRNIGRTAFRISLFSPKDIWIFGTRYNFYHWNGTDFQKMTIPGFPIDDVKFGDQKRMVKTKKGKLFLPSEISSQVYVIAQGTP